MSDFSPILVLQIKIWTLLTVEGYFKPEEWQDADGVKHNRVVLVATKFYEPSEKEEETPAPEAKTAKRKGK